jgi:ATP-dependent Clp protease ATP-binding subunit ClpA
MATKKAPSGSELDAWTELDLTAAATRGELREAFEMQGALEQITEVLESRRHLILVGESGVGKTAVIHELVRRLPTAAPSPLHGKRVLQPAMMGDPDRVTARAVDRPGSLPATLRPERVTSLGL